MAFVRQCPGASDVVRPRGVNMGNRRLIGAEMEGYRLEIGL